MPQEARIRHARFIGALLVLAALPVAFLAFAALVGLGLLRELPAIAAVALAATLLLSTAAGASRPFAGRRVPFAIALAGVAVGVLALLPFYQPGERAPALARGLRQFGVPEGVVSHAVVWLGWLGPERSRAFAPAPTPLPAALAVDQVEPAQKRVARPLPPSPAPAVAAERPAPEVDGEAIPLTRAGEHLLVSGHLESQHGADDVRLILDTGAALTTLTSRAAESVELEVTDASPVVRLNGVGGQSEGRLTVVDALRLGDQAVGPLTVAVCDDCLPTRGEGLLGIDVLDRFATQIDADALRLTLRPSGAPARADLVTPFLEVEGRLSVRRSGEILGDLALRSVAPVPVFDVRVVLECPGERFDFAIDQLAAHGEERLDVALPWGTACPEFRVFVDDAHWR